VVGRALRRTSYAADEDGMFEPEYAEVYGVPFSFIPSTGATGDPKPRVIPTRVRAMDARLRSEITFPRFVGYRYEIPDGKLSANFSGSARMIVSTADLPSKTEMAGKIGETVFFEMYDKNTLRKNTVAFEIATHTMTQYFRDDDGHDRPWLFPQVLAIAKRWIDECVVLKDNTYVGWLTIGGWKNDAADRVYKSIVQGEPGAPRLLPILRPYDTIGSTRYVDFDTTKR
jgi:type III restriction enzyme